MNYQEVAKTIAALLSDIYILQIRVYRKALQNFPFVPLLLIRSLNLDSSYIINSASSLFLMVHIWLLKQRTHFKKAYQKLKRTGTKFMISITKQSFNWRKVLHAAAGLRYFRVVWSGSKYLIAYFESIGFFEALIFT